MTKLEKLNGELVVASKKVEQIKELFLDKKRELILIEDQLVEAREQERVARECYETYRDTYVIEKSIDDERNADIAAFRERMPAAMAKIEHETPLPIIWSGTLDGAKIRR